MRSVFRLPIYTTAAACAALVLVGCGGGGGGGGTPAASTFDVVGRVFSASTGQPIGGATVQLSSPSRSVTTDAGGVYRIDALATTFSGGTLTISANGFSTETANVSSNGSAPQGPAVGLTPVGTPVNITPSAGGQVTQGIAEAPALPSVTLQIPAGALTGSSTVPVSLTPVVNQPAESLVTAQAVGDTSARAPEIEVRISPSGMVANSDTQITIPLPFAMQPGAQVPMLQYKNGAWREMGMATVDAGGTSATGMIREFLPTGFECWHDFLRSTQSMPPVTLQEMSMGAIQNDINNLEDQHYVVTRMIEAGRTAEITALFRWQFEQTGLPTQPVDEEVLCLGPAAYRNLLADYFASGQWNIAGGPVTFTVFVETVTVRRFVDGQNIGTAGTFVVRRGWPSWAVPSTHNQGGVG